MQARFTVREARALLPSLREHVADLIRLRADFADAQAALQRGDLPVGGLAEVKSVEAHLQEAVDWFARRDIDLKGIAPVIADFPVELAGETVMLCWLEGEGALDWYHRPEAGFAGRRRLPLSAGA